MARQSAPTLLHSFLHWEKTKPNGVFLTQPTTDGVTDYTWGEVGDQARRLAACIRSLGLPAGSHVALLGKNSAHWVIADIAIMMAGMISVPLYPTMSGGTARYVLDHAETKLLIIGKLDGTSDNWPEIRQSLPPNLPLVALPMAPSEAGTSWAEVMAHAPLTDVATPGKDDVATIVYTSGSTGRPKGVVHSFASMLAIQRGLESRNGVLPSDRLLSYLPLAHVAERMMEGMALYYGLHIFFTQSLATFSEDIARARPTVFLSVPRLWTKFRQGVDEALPPRKQAILFAIPGVSRLIKRKILRKLGLDQVRMAASGTAPIPPDLIHWYKRLGLQVLEGYGMSENFAMSHFTERGRIVPGQVGTCFAGVDARIDETGEILVRSPGQMLRYHREPDLTAAAMTPDGFLRTGDRGTIDRHGALTITGRTKDIFKTAKGKYVAPVPIENAIQLPGIEAVCVMGAGRSAPIALLLPSAEKRAELADPAARAAIASLIRKELAEVNTTLEPHERLGLAVLVDDDWTPGNGCLTPTLKIVRAKLEEEYGKAEFLPADPRVVVLGGAARD